MKATIDVKSAILGLIIGAVTMFAIGAGSSSNRVGRYQISAGSQGCAVIVDTTTGQAWAFEPPTTVQYRNDGGFFDAK
jgi:hypothetical protein